MDSPHKILRIITRLNIGGPAIHTILLTREMEPLGYATKLIAGSCENDDGDMKYLLHDSDPVLWVTEMSRSIRPWRNLQALYRLWRIMRIERPQIVHTHTAMAGCLGRTAAVLAGVPVIVHTFHGNSLRHYFSPVANAIFIRVERLLARWTDAICVLSEQQANEINGEFGVGQRSRFRVVPLGLDLSQFLQVPRRPLGETLRIGWFGRFVPVKDVPLLVNVITEILKTTQRIEFHVAGDGPDAALIEHVSHRYPSAVTWHGWLRDITPVLEQCDILIQTSKNEGTPVALIQGMAAGRPFLSTAAGGVADMVSGTGEPGPGGRWFANGVLVEPNAESFRGAVHHLIARPDRLPLMSAAAREFAAGRYRKETLCANLDLLYTDLIGKKFAHASPATVSGD